MISNLIENKIDTMRMVQMTVIAGEPQRNLSTMLKFIGSAQSEGIKVIAFPEMCLSGYLIGDRWEFAEFIDEVQDCHQKILRAAPNMTVIWGSVLRDQKKLGEDGRQRLYNAWFACKDGKWLSHCDSMIATPKTLLPNYRLFDESRYFYDLRKLAYERKIDPSELLNPIEVEGEKMGIILCEDGWDADYNFSPIDVLIAKGAQSILNLSCSPFSLGKSEKRDRVFLKRAQQTRIPIIYLNAFSVQNVGKTFYLFDGDSTVYYPGKSIIEPLNWAEAGFFDLKIKDLNLVDDKIISHPRPNESIRVLTGLQRQLKWYLDESGLQRVVIGASGGIDSAVNAALVASVVGPQNLLLVNMPSKFNSKLTKDLAYQLAQNIGCWYAQVSIEESVEITRRQMGTLEIYRHDNTKTLSLSEFHFENVQARDRSARILSALACSFGGVFTCNANKAEMTVGYSTLYGDLGGFLAPIGDLWKYQVYELGRTLNIWSQKSAQTDWIPEGVFSVVPSAELSAAQNVDEGQGDPLKYSYHDFLFKLWTERWVSAGPEQILEWYRSGAFQNELEKFGMTISFKKFFNSSREFIEDLEKWYGLFCGLGQIKRIQAPPVLGISKRPFGNDWREAVLKPYYSQKFLDLRRELIEKESI